MRPVQWCPSRERSTVHSGPLPFSMASAGCADWGRQACIGPGQVCESFRAAPAFTDFGTLSWNATDSPNLNDGRTLKTDEEGGGTWYRLKK